MAVIEQCSLRVERRAAMLRQNILNLTITLFRERVAKKLLSIKFISNKDEVAD
jgi:hypothetical protein